MRLFIGIPLSSDLKAEVSQFIELNRKSYSGLKWTVPENLHITLKFLGEVEPKRTDMLCSRLKEIALVQSQFSLALGQLGCFPNRAMPRVLWIGITQGTEQLCFIAETVEMVCTQLGFAAADQPFRPHLTIARIGSNSDAAVNLDEKDIFQSRSVVHSFALIESKLSSRSARYQIIDHFKLGKGRIDSNE